MLAVPVPSYWRARSIGFLVLLVVGLALDPLARGATEPPPPPPSAPATPAVSAAAATPCWLRNVSYEPGQQMLVGTVRKELPGAARVRVEDVRGKPLAGVPVSFEVVSRPHGGDDALVASTVVSAADGIAAANVHLGSEDGAYVVAARAVQMRGPMPNIMVTALKTTWWLMVVVGLLGGLGLFFYGLELGSGGLQKVAGSRMRSILSKLTTNRFTGVGLGAVVTALVQSSTATTVMVVGFVSAALMTLTQSMGVTLGAHIGTTLTVQLIAFKISDYALLMIGVGVLITVITKRKMYIYLGEIILGFGMIFYGMAVMSAAVEPLGRIPAVSRVLLSLGDHPLFGVLVAIPIAALMHSGGTIGLAVVLAGQGLIDLQSALPIVIGANIGTTATTVLVSLGSSAEGKRAGIAHLLFQTINALLFFPFLGLYSRGIIHITHLMGSSSVPREIANAHMFYNIANAVILLPFLTPLAWLLTRMFPKEEEAKEVFTAQYLDNNLLETPEMALAAAYQEILRTSRIVGDMIRQIVQSFGAAGEKARRDLMRRRDEVAVLTDSLQQYYIRLSQKNLGLFQSREKHGHLSIVDDLRQTAQYVGTDLVERATALCNQGVDFTAQGRQELLQYQTFTAQVHDETQAAMEDRNIGKAREIRHEKDQSEAIERKLRESHLARLDAGLAESAATSAAHMDLLSGMRQIGRHHFRICHALEEFLTEPG